MSGSVLGRAESLPLTAEHLRLAASLAIPASLAVQNARLHERAEIFRAELERHLLNPLRTEN
jgi:hypothetical protein